jgi:DNA repair exonuclease SbcCD ATPase subunit
MRVLELSLRNYRIFEEVDLELPARVIGIFGENGAGKSSLMESIAFACYGVDAARTKKHEIRTHGILTDCLVRLVFEHAGQQYEVRRTIKGKGHTPEAELFGGDMLLASGTTEVDAEIRRLLHMDLHVFRASVYAEQKQLDAFSDVTPGRRKEMALRLLGIRPVEEARNASRREARATKESAVQLAGAVADLAALEAELKDAKEATAEAKHLAKAAAAELKGTIAVEKAATRAFAESDAVRQRIETLTVELRAKTEQHGHASEQQDALAERVQRMTEALAELPAIEEQLGELAGIEERLRLGSGLAERSAQLAKTRAQLDAVPEIDEGSVLAALEAAAAALERARAAAAGAEAERAHRAALLEQALERLDRAADADPSQPCPTCGRPLGNDFTSYVKHCKAEAADAKKAAAAAAATAKRDLADRVRAEKEQAGAADAGERAREQAARRTQLAERVDGLTAEIAQLAEPFDGAVPELDELRASAERARTLAARATELGAQRQHLDQAERDLAAARTRIDKLDAELARLAGEAEGLAFDEAQHARLRDEREHAAGALEEARSAERGASDALKDAEKAEAELVAALRQAKETQAKVDELRSEARYVERVAMLLEGFRDHLVARVGPELSREAEALFRELTNHEYDDLKVDEEKLTIQIADGDSYFAIDRFSGSETDLANLALRVAISTQLSRLSGADVGMMVLDEVLASLDEERKDLMVQALGRLSSRFHQLFVVTHAEQVKDQFPASILVQKVGRRRSTAVLV